jgi:cell shape-determining protein MreC
MSKANDSLDFSVKPYLLWIGACGLLWLISPLPPVRAITGMLEQAMVATSGVGQAGIAVVTSPVRFVVGVSESSRRIADLENRLALASIDKAQLEEYKRKEAEMAALLRVPVPPTFTVQATAKVVEGPEGRILTAGAKDGVEAGMVVVDSSGILLGLVGETSTYISRVVAITRLAQPLAVTLAGKQIPGVLLADGTVVRLTNVAQGAGLMVGDTIITDGLDGHLPAGLVIGQVMKIESKPAEVMQTALVELLAKPEGEVLIGR